MFQLSCAGLSIMKPLNKPKGLFHLDISLEFVLTYLWVPLKKKVSINMNLRKNL